jgi:hypothetical protein
MVFVLPCSSNDDLFGGSLLTISAHRNLFEEALKGTLPAAWSILERLQDL